MAEPARGVRAGREGVVPAGVACGAWCAQVGAQLLLIEIVCVANVVPNGRRSINNSWFSTATGEFK